MAEVAFTETNFLGRGQYVRLSVSDGQYSQGWKASFTEPYFLGQRLAAGFDIYHQVQLQNQYALYQNWTTGVNAAARRSDHRRADVPAELFALPVEDHDSEHRRRSPMTTVTGRTQPWIIGGTFYAVTPTAVRSTA